MSTDYAPIEGDARPARPLRTTLVAIVIAFLAGLVVMGLVLKSWGGHFGLINDPSAPAQGTEAVDPNRSGLPETTLGAGPPVQTVVDPRAADELQGRVRELEQRMARISISAEAASGNAARAEGLLVAFAARRALDRGVGLGYIEAQLRERFGETQPRAVATIISNARQPITLGDLQAGLVEIGPALIGGGTEASWWDGVRRELGELFVIRKAGTPSPIPSERLSRAKRRLDSGQVDAALAEVSRLPGRAKAEDWMAAARRYVEARRALDTIETAAILSPRTLTLPPAPVPDMSPSTDAAETPAANPASPAAPAVGTQTPI